MRQVDPHLKSTSPDLVALSNSDLNLLGEFHHDQHHAQSFAYTESTIQTEHQRIASHHQKPSELNQVDGRFSMHHHVAKNAAVL